MRLMTVALLVAALGLSACQTRAGASPDQPASVDLSVPETRAGVSAALATALNLGRVELGVTQVPQTSTVTVLPPPLGPHETHSPAVPIRFDIIRRKGVSCGPRRYRHGAPPARRDLHRDGQGLEHRPYPRHNNGFMAILTGTAGVGRGFPKLGLIFDLDKRGEAAGDFIAGLKADFG